MDAWAERKEVSGEQGVVNKHFFSPGLVEHWRLCWFGEMRVGFVGFGSLGGEWRLATWDWGPRIGEGVCKSVEVHCGNIVPMFSLTYGTCGLQGWSIRIVRVSYLAAAEVDLLTISDVYS